MYIVSACLAGIDCKYDGENNENEKILNLVREGKAVLVCPEQMGGLSTPRVASEVVIDNGKTKVMSKDGRDVTKNFFKGAEETLKIAKMMGIKKAILKARSPSCGYGQTYDGTFSRTLTKANGITAELLDKNSIKIYTEENFDVE